MIIESTKVDVNAGQEEIFNFLTNSNNIIHLLPQDKISDWQSTDTECSFKAQGGFKISLIQDGSEGNSKVFMKSGEKSPFPFKLTLFINEANGKSNGYIEFNGDVNMFLRKMVEKPLTGLFNHMAEKIQERFA
jgi:hypothetical protein